MLHIIKSNPKDNDVLQKCLAAFKPDDALLLMGQGVIAQNTDEFKEALSLIDNLYVLESDLVAYDIKEWYGTDINMDGVVNLIVKYGSPLTWN